MLSVIANSIVIALSIQYPIQLIISPEHSPAWVQYFVKWWRGTAPENWYGKPFTCPFCLAWWLAVVGTAILVPVVNITDVAEVTLTLLSSASLGYIIYLTINRLSIISLH